jgi:GNAT superfamily N-acetyltransferase
MKIIQATTIDIESAAELFNEYRVFYGKPSDIEAARKFLADRINNNESVIYIAYDENGNGMGFTQLYPLFSSTRVSKLWLLNDLYVNDKFRKKGVAEALLERAKQLAKETGSCGLTLETANSNLPAQKLYEKNGWQRDEEHTFFSWEIKKD